MKEPRAKAFKSTCSKNYNGVNDATLFSVLLLFASPSSDTLEHVPRAVITLLWRSRSMLVSGIRRRVGEKM